MADGHETTERPAVLRIDRERGVPEAVNHHGHETSRGRRGRRGRRGTPEHDEQGQYDDGSDHADGAMHECAGPKEAVDEKDGEEPGGEAEDAPCDGLHGFPRCDLDHEGAGGHQSASIALLDAGRSGVVFPLRSIHSIGMALILWPGR